MSLLCAVFRAYALHLWQSVWAFLLSCVIKCTYVEAGVVGHMRWWCRLMHELQLTLRPRHCTLVCVDGQHCNSVMCSTCLPQPAQTRSWYSWAACKPSCKSPTTVGAMSQAKLFT
jgi:hypothetical protein